MVHQAMSGAPVNTCVPICYQIATALGHLGFETEVMAAHAEVVLSGLGEQLAESTKERLKRLGAKLRKPSHESNVEKLTEVRRITIELKAADPSFAFPLDVRSAIVAELVESGLDADRAADIAARVAKAISDE